MPDETATAYWKTNQLLSRPGHHAINAWTRSHKSKSLNQAVIFVMEDPECRRENAWIVKADGTPIDLPVIEQIYATIKSK